MPNTADRYITIELVSPQNGFTLTAFVLKNPDEGKLNRLEEIINNRLNSEEKIDYQYVYNYVHDNFEVFPIAETITIKW